MKTLTHVLPLGLFILCGSVVVAQDAKAPERPNREQIIKQLDADGDGKISDAERTQAREAMQQRMAARQGGAKKEKLEDGSAPGRDALLKQYDTNKDGKIDDAERAAAREDIQKNRANAPATRNPERSGPSREALMKEFDKDGDGKLTASELEAAREAMLARGRPAAGTPGRGPSFNQESLLKKYDANGDGKLDDSERTAARKAMQSQTEQRRPDGPPPGDTK